MRLTRLVLERYGHVSGERLEFPAAFGLHVVLGVNEAGKSTALEAVADALFGFPARHRGRLSHPDDPRIRFTLRASDGFEASFIRRKFGRDKLLDSAETPVPELALARFLGGTGRDRFQDVFGLDGERLRQAGQTIMAEQGEAGAAILQAQTGLRGLRETVQHLDEQSKALFGDGRGQRRISAAAAAIKENRRLIAERSVSGADYLRVQAREAALSQRVAEIGHERLRLRAEQSRLNRIRGTAPFRAELAEIARDLAAVGPAIALPEDARARHDACRAARDQSVRDRLRETGEMEAIDAALARLQPDLAVLREAAAVTALEADLSRIADARRDHLLVSGQAAASRATADDLARRLGVAERGTALDDRLPDIVTRRTIEWLREQHAKIAGETDSAEAAVGRAMADAADADRDLATLPAAADRGPLREAIDDARDAGPIDAELAKAARVRDTAAAAAARGLASLALWCGTIAELEATSVPLEAEADRLGSALERAETASREAAGALQSHDAALEACRVAQLGIEAAGPLPTVEMLDAIRARRDLAWRFLRRQLEGGAPPTDAEWAGGPAAFESLMREADALSDARYGELARIEAWERQREEAARLAAQHPDLLAAQRSAEGGAHRAAAEWTAAWAPARVAPLRPAAMREWVRDRAAVLAGAEAARLATQVHGDLEKRCADLRARLSALVAPGDAAGLAPLLREAVRTLGWLDRQATERTAAVERVDRTNAELGEALRTRASLEQRAQRWSQDWAPVAQRLGLPADADPHVAGDLLSLWSELDKELDRWRGFDGRLTQMRSAISQHDEAVAALAQRLAVPLTETLMTDLAGRRQTAMTDAAEQVRLQRQRDSHAAAIERHRTAEAAAADELAALQRAAGTDDDAGLAAAIDAQAHRAELLRRRAEREATLRGLADGKTDAALAAEAAMMDIDAIPGRIEAIEARTAALDREASDAAGELAQLRQELRAMQAGQDVAGPAQAVQDSLAEIEDAAHRYIRLRLAQALLQGGVERYRRGQQGPLLAKAGLLFQALTVGRYVRLEQDESEKGEPIIVAVRADGSTCPAGALSAGTTDQLFLALRLASIALDAGTSEPMPFIADDLLVNFDDARATAALQLLSDFGKTTQVILFTHHRHVLDLVAPRTASIHRLPEEIVSAAEQ